MSSTFVFKPASVQNRWSGRYSRIVGDTTAFKINNTLDYGFWPVIYWDNSEGRITCTAKECEEVEKLVASVNKAKMSMTGPIGGSFCINEYGQVIVPSSAGNGYRLLVGEIEGVLLFIDDLGNTIDLSDDYGLETGDDWDKPYIGMRYNLHQSSYIYFYDQEDGSTYPVSQDEELIEKIRKLRRYGPVRFIVNPYGLVLTKVPSGEYSRDHDDWVAVYVGKINKNLWFRKEF